MVNFSGNTKTQEINLNRMKLISHKMISSWNKIMVYIIQEEILTKIFFSQQTWYVSGGAELSKKHEFNFRVDYFQS